MAENPIESKDLIDIKDIEKGFDKLGDLYEATGKRIVESTTASKKSIQSLTDVNEESIKQLNEQAVVINKLEKELKEVRGAQEDLVKTKKKINKLNEEEIKDRIKLQREIKKVRDAIKDELDIQDKQAGTLKKIRLESKRLRNERESLNLATKEGTDRLAEINAQLDKNNEIIVENSDKMKKQRLNVGNYTDSIKEAIEGTSFLGNETTIINNIFNTTTTIVSKVTNNLTNLKNSFISVNKSGKRSIKMLKGFKVALAATGIGAIVLLLVGLFKSFTANADGARSLERIMARVTATISVLVGVLVDVGKGFFNLLSALKDFSSFNFEEGAKKVSNGVDLISGAFDNLGDKIEKQIENQLKLVATQQKLRDVTRGLRIEIAEAAKIEQLRGQVADDTTKSFVEREKAAQQADAAARNRAGLQRQLAQEELDVVNQRIALAKEVNQVTEVLLDEQVEAQVNLIDAEQELLGVEIENAKRRNELRQDRLERDLDFLLDIFDNQKTINERIIADQEVSFERRQALLVETNRLSDKSFDEQVLIIEEFAGQRIAFNELVAESDAEVVRERIRGLGLSEIIEGRALEIIRDRKTANADLLEAERDLNKSRQAQIEKNFQEELKAIKAFADTRLKIRELELLRAGASEEEIQKQLFQERIFLLELQIKQLGKLDEKTLDLELELQRLRVKAEQDANAKIIADRKALAEQIKEQSFQLINDLIDFGAQANEQAREDELEAFTEANEAEFKQLEDDVAKGLKTEEQAAKIRESRENEFKIREKQLKQEQARADKQNEIFKATIAGFRAVIEAGGFTPQGIATAIFNAAQIALLAATPLPKFKKGGSPTDGVIDAFTIGGKSHARGGTKFWGDDGTAFEAEKGEGSFAPGGIFPLPERSPTLMSVFVVVSFNSFKVNG